MTAQCVLHTFYGGALSVINKSGILTADQVAALRPAAVGPAGHQGHDGRPSQQSRMRTVKRSGLLARA